MPFGGVPAGLALFALTYGQVGHYTTIFGFPAVVAFAGWACTMPACGIDRD